MYNPDCPQEVGSVQFEMLSFTQNHAALFPASLECEVPQQNQSYFTRVIYLMNWIWWDKNNLCRKTMTTKHLSVELFSPIHHVSYEPGFQMNHSKRLINLVWIKLMKIRDATSITGKFNYVLLITNWFMSELFRHIPLSFLQMYFHCFWFMDK